MRKIILLCTLAAAMTLTSCISDRWLNSDSGYRTDNRQNPPPPPRDDRYGNYNNNGYYNNGSYYSNDRYYNNNSRYRNRPAIGTSVLTLPGNAQRITSGGNELYVCNGVLYQPVRSRNGVSYRVVGYRDY